MSKKKKLASQSWGKNFNCPPKEVLNVSWQSELEDFNQWNTLPNLAFGLGRSYGDSCLNKDGRIVKMNRLDRILNWNESTGVLHIEAGISLKSILNFIVPKGWFLPVSPGTQFVTIGGAVANDVHGKNHHNAGTIGRFIEELTLLKTSGDILVCSPMQNKELFAATIGGLGLTGIIISLKIKLKYASPVIKVETIPFHGVDEFTSLSIESQEYEYTVAWIDCVNTWKSKWGRGLFMRGDHSPIELRPRKKTIISVPIDAPSILLNRYTCKLFNEIYFKKNSKSIEPKLVDYQPFFYPLDSVLNWNRIYGSKGFFQYQLQLPMDSKDALNEIFEIIAKSGFASFLAVLKTFGRIESPGMLSFPKEGYTLALDFSNRGFKTKAILKQLTQIVNSSGGRLYPAKDSIMTGADFLQYYSNWDEFQKHRDPNISSSFIRRIFPIKS